VSGGQFRVSPEHVQQLSSDLQAVADGIQDFLNNKGDQLSVPPNALDPVSKDAAAAFKQNADTAIQQATAFANNLNTVVTSLDQTARGYQTSDDAAASTLNRS
jgi:uncharacterized protein YukE